MRKFLMIGALLVGSATVGADTVVDRWAAAVGGRDKVATITSTYREAIVEVEGHEGSIRMWRSTDGKYRKEEQIADYSLVETFDGTTGMVQQGDAAPRAMTPPELARAKSTAFANSSAMFFAFFPDQRRGTLTIEGNELVLSPEGGIDWRVTFDPETWLPKTMVHREGERTITVTFLSYETVDGVKFEKELHRAMGAGGFEAMIRFTKTVLNPPLDPSRFSIKEELDTVGSDRF